MSALDLLRPVPSFTISRDRLTLIARLRDADGRVRVLSARWDDAETARSRYDDTIREMVLSLGSPAPRASSPGLAGGLVRLLALLP